MFTEFKVHDPKNDYDIITIFVDSYKKYELIIG